MDWRLSVARYCDCHCSASLRNRFLKFKIHSKYISPSDTNLKLNIRVTKANQIMFKGGIVRTLPGRFFRFLTEFNRGQFTLERYKRERKNLINSLIFLSSFSSLGNGSKSIHAVPKLRTREPGRHTTTERNWR